MLLMEYGVDSPQFGTMLFSVATALLSLFMTDRPASARKTGARAVAVALLAVLSLIQEGPLLLTGGLLAFAAGQAFLVQDDDRATGIGLICLICLSVGQLVYAVVLFGFVRFAEVVVPDWSLVSGGLTLITVAVIFAKTVGFAFFRNADAPVYLAAAVASCVFSLLATTGGVAIGCFLLTYFAGATVAFAIGGPSRPRPPGPLLFSGRYSMSASFFSRCR